MKHLLLLVLAMFMAVAFVAGCSKSQQAQNSAPWQFAVSGDSRSCGDVVMPMIAADVLQYHPEFYWHLGDFRATYKVDEDIAQQPEHLAAPLSLENYRQIEWQDFIDNQVAPFRDLPVYLSIGNHELLGPKVRGDYVKQFSGWLDRAELRAQRLQDDAQDRDPHIYFHWHKRNIDFISMDNASAEQFDDAQVAWVERVLQHDANDPQIATVVIGMHEALPDSISEGHSMSQFETGVSSGRRVYQDLLHVANGSHKHVYILASHSHFYMANIFNTEYVLAHGGELPGWIVGTAGAVRYALPVGSYAASAAQTNVYGYMLANVSPSGTIDFQFHELDEPSVPAAIVSRYTQEFVHWCFAKNSEAR
jgi:hypothetical protein